MKYVIKLGGAGLENPSLLQGCVRAISDALVQHAAYFDSEPSR